MVDCSSTFKIMHDRHSHLGCNSFDLTRWSIKCSISIPSVTCTSASNLDQIRFSRFFYSTRMCNEIGSKTS
ncbi:hypothetical protein BDR22DRAFT_842809 [Usnea florida]